MTRLLSIDPGGNTGITLGEYSDTEPYRLLERWQVHGGVDGFVRWWNATRPTDAGPTVVVCEKFILALDNDFSADLTPVQIEGALIALEGDRSHNIIWQPRTDKSSLTGYSPEAKRGTKAMRQRERFDFLDRFGLFVAGTENDDSNDAATHALVYLRRAEHRPTQLHYWPPRRRPA